jgi:hypothetical protein
MNRTHLCYEDKTPVCKPTIHLRFANYWNIALYDHFRAGADAVNCRGCLVGICKHCGRSHLEHPASKCLFHATTFEAVIAAYVPRSNEAVP